MERKEYRLYEKIYSGGENDNTKSILESFFQEVLKKTTSEYEEGAAIVILPEKMACKICEGIGRASHEHSQVNLVRFLNGNTEYLDPIESRSASEIKLLSNIGIGGRVISTNGALKLVFFADRMHLTAFQKKMLQEIITVCKELKDLNIYPSVLIGISTEEFSLEYGELTEEHFEEGMGSLQHIK